MDGLQYLLQVAAENRQNALLIGGHIAEAELWQIFSRTG